REPAQLSVGDEPAGSARDGAPCRTTSRRAGGGAMKQAAGRASTGHRSAVPWVDGTSGIETLGAGAAYDAMAAPHRGLTSTEAAIRLESTGQNVLREIGRPSLPSRLVRHFTHLMAMLLWAAAVVAFVAGLPELTVAIVLVNLVNGTVSYRQDFKDEHDIAAVRRGLPG